MNQEWKSVIVSGPEVGAACQERQDDPTGPWMLWGAPTWAGTVAGAPQFLLLFNRHHAARIPQLLCPEAEEPDPAAVDGSKSKKKRPSERAAADDGFAMAT